MKVRRIVLLAVAFLLLAAPLPAFSDTTYVVEKGDTLSTIAKEFHVPVGKLKKANRLRSNRIAAGTRLRIPERSAIAVTRDVNGLVADGSRDHPPAGPAQLHTVRKGDTLRSISRKYDVPESELRRNNSLKRGKRLQPGSRIVVRTVLPEKYVVRKADTLSKIALKFGLDPEDLTARNELDAEALSPGQELALRDRAEEPAPSDTTACPTEEDLREAARPQPPAATDNAVEPLQERMIRVAKKMLSIPYRWGGATLRGIDCSAYVRKVYGFLNLELPRSAREQFQVGEQVEKGDLSIGDLVFFRTYAKYPSHVGIYLGDNRFIHASSRSREVKISSLDHPYYEKRYLGAKRLLFGENDVRN